MPVRSRDTVYFNGLSHHHGPTTAADPLTGDNSLLARLEKLQARLLRTLLPVSVPKLQDALIPLIAESPTGFPAALVRAHLLAQDAPNALMPLGKLQRGYLFHSKSPEPLVRKLIQSESAAYLASHLVALETALKNPNKQLTLGRGLGLKALRLGLEDAKTVVSHRVKQPVYTPRDKGKIADSLYNLIQASPKVALHEHYSGCAPMPLGRSWLLDQAHPKAYKGYDALQEYFRTDRLYTPDGEGPLYQRSLKQFLLKNDNLVTRSIRSTETAYLGAYMYTLRMALENVRYFEYRLHPFSRNAKDPLKYAQAIQQGIDDARDFLMQNRRQRIDANLIFSANRHPKPGAPLDDRVDKAMAVLDLAIQARQQGLRVTGFDIQGDEEGYAITDFAPVAQKLRAYNQMALAKYQAREWASDLRIGATLHAGETAVSGTISHPQNVLTGAQSIAKAIELFWDTSTPVRIGHGVHIQDDPALIRTCVQKNIGIEQCPKSNVQTGAVSYYSSLPTLELLRRYKLPVSISCDNSTTSKTNTCNELVKLTRHLGARHPDRKRLQMNGIDTAFIFDTLQKTAIKRDMQTAYRKIEAEPMFQRVMTLEKGTLSFQQLLNNQVR